MEMNVDVLIAGSGVAGLYCALNLNSNLKVLIITKSKLTETNTYLAQGGISTARDEKDIPLFIEDTLKAGQYKNDRNSVQILAEESMNSIDHILTLGVVLDKIGEDLQFTKEGAHSINRIVHNKDTTGKALADALIEHVKTLKNVTIFEDTYLVDIIKDNNTCVGGIAIKENTQFNIKSKVLVLATGGIGGIFNNSTNQRLLTGDGIAIAIRNNIKLKDLNYIQFHPTALFDENIDNRRFLISEAVRGEGGKLINSKGERFIDELLPRDVVSNAINEEIKNSGIPNVWLDITFLDSEYIKKRFPNIYEECLIRGIDITKEPIPVSPAQHYFMGGIETDSTSKTSLENLYAAGEVSCTGVHGANRLASNSLLEGLVFSKRAADSINKNITNIEFHEIAIPKVSTDVEKLITENKELAIEEFKRRSKDLNDELFNHR
ncbi:MAG: L-aspartate oxidase [Clostridiaceae bacterium]|nr:L-aspartate oxidase [Clostridiaceae bacterium]